jgi:ubiquinone/menaquinone biosynthesis C-methylase UbiE
VNRIAILKVLTTHQPESMRPARAPSGHSYDRPAQAKSITRSWLRAGKMSSGGAWAGGRRDAVVSVEAAKRTGGGAFRVAGEVPVVPVPGARAEADAPWAGYREAVSTGQDRWARWVLSRRPGDDGRVSQQAADALAVYRDGVLDRAAIAAGDTVLDIGTGAGLIAFGALGLVGPTGRVVFSDISADLLDECRRRAEVDGVLDRCRFVHAGADDLRGVADASVDVVTTRSVLSYVERKAAAFAEFARVLRPGGRLSIFEPVNSFAGSVPRFGLYGLDVAPVVELVAKVREVYAGGTTQHNPMLSFDERDLLRWVRQAGFTAVAMDYRAEIDVPERMPPTDWDVLRRTAPNPLAPTLDEAIAQALTDEERERFEHHVRPALADGAPTRKTVATVYLRAVRP